MNTNFDLWELISTMAGRKSNNNKLGEFDCQLQLM